MGNDRLCGTVENFLAGDFQWDFRVFPEAVDLCAIHIALVISREDDGAGIALPIFR